MTTTTSSSTPVATAGALVEALNRSDWQQAVVHLPNLKALALPEEEIAPAADALALAFGNPSTCADAETHATADAARKQLALALAQWLADALHATHWGSDASRSIARAIAAFALSSSLSSYVAVELLGGKFIHRLVSMWRRGGAHAGSALVALCSGNTCNVGRFVKARGVFVADTALVREDEPMDALLMIELAVRHQHQLTSSPRYGGSMLVQPLIENVLNALAPASITRILDVGILRMFLRQHAVVGIKALHVLQCVLSPVGDTTTTSDEKGLVAQAVQSVQDVHKLPSSYKVFAGFDFPQPKELSDAIACMMRRFPKQAYPGLHAEAHKTLWMLLNAGVIDKLPPLPETPAVTATATAAATASAAHAPSPARGRVRARPASSDRATPRRKRSRWSDANPSEQAVAVVPEPKSVVKFARVLLYESEPTTTGATTPTTRSSRFRGKQVDDYGGPSPTRVTMDMDK